MFSEKIILEKLSRFTAKFKWTPVRHSIEEVQKATAYIQSLCITDSKGNLEFPDTAWTPKLVQFIQNERAICAMDCEYFLTRYYKIAADNRILLFTFRSGQRAFFSVVQALEAAGKSIEIQTLKARQQGISTLIEGIMTHRALFVPGAKCSVASANDQKTLVMMGMMYTALEHLPWWLTPTRTKDKRSGAPIMEYSHVGTSIVIQSGSMKGGVGQGTTPTAIHLSEVCDFTDPVAQIEEGLLMAVHSSPEIFMVLESTGNGNTGWWAEQWRNNKENYHKGLTRFFPLFLPWFMTPELFPPQSFRKEHPVPADWRPSKEARSMTAKCEVYVRSTPLLGEILGNGWKLPIEQQWFWDWKFQDHKRRRVEKSWLRQMPCDDFEALSGENDSVFDWDTINTIESKRKREFDLYGILGEGIAEKHDPSLFDVDKYGQRHYVTWKTPREDKLSWVLMPVIADNRENSKFDPLKKLIIYEYPERGVDYAIGVDTGTGVGGDRSIISVSRVGSDADCDTQVAEFASDDITNVEIYSWVAAIAAFYGQYMESPRHPKLIIEQRRKYGDTCQHQLKLMGMQRHHEFVEYDKKTLKPKSSVNGRQGWYTNAWSRPMLLGMFKYAVENGWYVVNSRWLLAEMEAQEQVMTVSGKTRMDHVSGKHDDRIFAAAMSYFTSHHLDVMIERAKKKYHADDEEGYIITYEPYQIVAENPCGDFFDQFD